MTVLTCAAVRQRLPAYYDNELALQDRIAVQGHMNECVACAAELQRFVEIGEAVRLTSLPGPTDDWNGLQPGVISRMRAEAHESWTAKFSRTFDDLHLVWIGMAATAATCVCAAIVFGMLHFASPEREDSLRAMIAVVSAPSGSDLNPASLDAFILVPSVPDDGLVSATLEQSGAEGELALALSAVITREGRISGLEVLENDQHRRQISQLLAGFSRGRLEPARRFGTDPIAVNLVWLVEHMTIKPKLRG